MVDKLNQKTNSYERLERQKEDLESKVDNMEYQMKEQYKMLTECQRKLSEVRCESKTLEIKKYYNFSFINGI